MDPNRDPHAGEDTSAAREHVANAKENRDPDNAEAMRSVAEGHDALEEQNRRVAASAPDDVPMTGPDDASGRR